MQVEKVPDWQFIQCNQNGYAIEMKNNIERLRKDRGWSQTKLGEESGTSGPQINRLEKSQRKLSYEWQLKLARALQVHPSDLVPPYDGKPRREELPQPADRGAMRDAGSDFRDNIKELKELIGMFKRKEISKAEFEKLKKKII